MRAIKSLLILIYSFFILNCSTTTPDFKYTVSENNKKLPFQFSFKAGYNHSPETKTLSFPNSMDGILGYNLPFFHTATWVSLTDLGMGIGIKAPKLTSITIYSQKNFFYHFNHGIQINQNILNKIIFQYSFSANTFFDYRGSDDGLSPYPIIDFSEEKYLHEFSISKWKQSNKDFSFYIRFNSEKYFGIGIKRNALIFLDNKPKNRN